MTEECREGSLCVDKDMDIDGSHFTYRQISNQSIKFLDYNYKRCVGCGICVGLCPAKALELGPMQEISTGLDAPPVMMDLEKCTFCSMCANFCPVHAFKMTEEGDFPEKDEFPVYDSYVTMNEKCLPCALCKAACPEDAIEVEFTFRKKEEIAPFKEDVEGEIEIDTDKCNFCGLCAEFCDAFLLVEKEATPTDPIPFDLLLVDEDKCDYCVLCQDLCPEDAIKVKGEKRGEAPEIEGIVTVDDEKCTRCTWCQVVCPYDAVDIKKQFEGELTLIDVNVDKCDPQGCHGCFNVCPSHLWYVPEDGTKIAIKADYCTYCGACVNACPKDVMKVTRTKVHHTDIPDSPWASQWRDAVDSMVTEKRNYPDVSRTLEVEKEAHKEHVEVEFPQIDGSLLRLAKERIEKTKPLLDNIKIRKMLENDLSGTMKEEFHKRIQKQSEQ
ncbi:4Fe-4S binding protein [Methanolobus mangrovi]|uniref:4Fe-4S binding protein n=2 Tax=Methanolobus mangrovi TaxID=3072977 RepID=A0AA51UHG3_9EURY|nr:4Fe-4S binding protein [Methanolobus mangrovi]WMW23215.1 4Fe-4S binding protein [Methanolobus mangrovi]